MKKLLIVFILGIFSSISAFAQEDTTSVLSRAENEHKESKIFYGGNLGLQFGTNTYVDISPLAGYKVLPKLGLGVGLTYQYLGFNGNGYSNYGARTFANYNVWKPIILQAEYEYLSVQAGAFTPSNVVEGAEPVTGRKGLNNFYLGGGIRQRMGSRSALDIMLLYNFNDVPDSPYDNPVIRVGFVVGL